MNRLRIKTKDQPVVVDSEGGSVENSGGLNLDFPQLRPAIASLLEGQWNAGHTAQTLSDFVQGFLKLLLIPDLDQRHLAQGEDPFGRRTVLHH